jgi:hypothetical protein
MRVIQASEMGAVAECCAVHYSFLHDCMLQPPISSSFMARQTKHKAPSNSAQNGSPTEQEQQAPKLHLKPESHSPARDRLPPPTSEIPARQSNTPPTTNTASQRHSVKYYTHARTHVQARQPRCVRYRTGAGPEGAPPPRERVSPFAVITVSCTPAPVQALAVRDSAMYHQPAFCVVNPAVRLALYIAVCRT